MISRSYATQTKRRKIQFMISGSYAVQTKHRGIQLMISRGIQLMISHSYAAQSYLLLPYLCCSTT